MIADKTMRPALARAAQVIPAGEATVARTPASSLLAAVEAPAHVPAKAGPGLDPGWASARRQGHASALDSDDVCRTCGACCSYSADWPRFSLESEAQLEHIPRELIGDGERGMRCTGNRCTALVGTVGRSTSCAIYPLRPDVCRTCLPGDAECREARRHFGL